MRANAFVPLRKYQVFDQLFTDNKKASEREAIEKGRRTSAMEPVLPGQRDERQRRQQTIKTERQSRRPHHQLR